MNDFTTADAVKVGFGVVLMAVWVGMLLMKVANADDIISFCKLGLTGLATHYLTSYTTPASPGSTVITTTPPAVPSTPAGETK